MSRGKAYKRGIYALVAEAMTAQSRNRLVERETVSTFAALLGDECYFNLLNKYKFDEEDITLFAIRVMLLDISVDIQPRVFHNFILPVVSIVPLFEATEQSSDADKLALFISKMAKFLKEESSLSHYDSEVVQHNIIVLKGIAMYKRFLHNFESTDSDNQELYQKMANFEYYSKMLAYLDLTDSSLVPGIEKDGRLSVYQVHVLRSKRGFIVYAFTVYDYATFSKKVVISFRGTYDTNAAILDMERPAPGHQSFKRKELSLLQDVNELLTKISKKYTVDNFALSICGHSLGGAFAQKFAIAVMRAMVINLCNNNVHMLEAELNREIERYIEHRDIAASFLYYFAKDKYKFKNLRSFKKINKIKVYTYNAAGIAYGIARNSIACAALLKRQNIEIKNFDLRVASDLVQFTGETHFLSGVLDRHAEVVCFKAGHGYERITGFILWLTHLGAILKAAHTSYKFESKAKFTNYKILKNNNMHNRYILRKTVTQKSLGMYFFFLVLRPIFFVLNKIYVALDEGSKRNYSAKAVAHVSEYVQQKSRVAEYSQQILALKAEEQMQEEKPGTTKDRGENLDTQKTDQS